METAPISSFIGNTVCMELSWYRTCLSCLQRPVEKMETIPHFPTAANAVRHGLAGTRHVPKEALEALKAIEADLIALKQPTEPEDFEILREMAQAQWQLGEHQRRQVEHLEMQIARGPEIFDQKARETFRSLLQDWQADPATHAEALSQSYLGAKHFAQIWQAVAESLGPDGAGLSLEMTCQAVMTEGISPRPEKIYGEGSWIMKRFLAGTDSPTESVKEWTNIYRMQTSKTTIDRAEKLFLTAPDTATSINELQVRAHEKYQYWDNLMQKRRKDYDLAKIQFTQANAGNGMGDKEMETQVRLMHRYRVSAQNRVDRLDRKLKNIQNERVRRLTRKYLWDQKEQQRKENRDYQVSRMTDKQYRHYSETVNNREDRELRELYQNMPQSQYQQYETQQYADPEIPPDMESNSVISTEASPGHMHVREAMEEQQERPQELPLTIIPEYTQEPIPADDEFQKLFDDLFLEPPHKGMFSHWPQRYLTTEIQPAFVQRLVQRKISLDDARVIYEYFMTKCGQEVSRQKADAEATISNDAINVRQARNRKARRAAKKARQANRR